MHIPTTQEYIKEYFLKYKDVPDSQRNTVVEHLLPFIDATREIEWAHRDCPPNELTDNQGEY